MHASSYVTDPSRSPVYVSGQEFLEEYAEEFSGVLHYRKSTFYPERSYCETLYDKFDRLYNDVESWDSTTLFASAVYRGLFHEMSPYQSQLCEVRTCLNYEFISETYLKKGVNDEAIFAAFGRRVKESDKVKRNLSFSACFHLMVLILYPYTDRSLILELIAVLKRTHIVATHQKQLTKELLAELDFTHSLTFLADPRSEMRKDLFRERLLWGLSLLQIDSNAAQKAVDDTLLSLSYGPIISLIETHSSTSEEGNLISDTASAYCLAPRYSAKDYIRDLVVSEEAYTRLFEEVQDSAAT